MKIILGVKHGVVVAMCVVNNSGRILRGFVLSGKYINTQYDECRIFRSDNKKVIRETMKEIKDMCYLTEVDNECIKNLVGMKGTVYEL
jgi:hypothetical protein